MEDFGNENRKYTLIFVKDEANENVLMGFKKRGFGKNLYNGFGGKIEPNENALDGAIRELEEESGLVVAKTDMKYVGFVTYHRHKVIPNLVYIFTTAISKLGLERETDEMKPQWFHFNQIPFDLMWKDKREWVLAVLKGKGIQAAFYYDEEDKIVKRDIILMDTLPILNESMM